MSKTCVPSGNPTNLPEAIQQASDLHRRGQSNEAERLCMTMLRAKPDDFDALHLLGIVRSQQGRYIEAMILCVAALKNNANSAEALLNYGNVLKSLGRFEEALVALDKALVIKPDYAEAFNDRGKTLLKLNCLEEALASAEKALAIRPDYAEALNNRGNILQYLNCREEALNSYKSALAIDPNYPTAHWNESVLRLLLGDFRAGWKKYEWRWKTKFFSSMRRDFSEPLWLGDRPIEGKTILLHSEQGFGDTIQFSRYATLVARQGAKVILEVPASLKDLLSDIDGLSGIVSRGEKLPAFDLHCPLLSLPLAFGTELDTIPADVPYLRPLADRVANWKERLAQLKSLRVGIAWSGSSGHKNDHRRSLALRRLAPLFSVAGIQFVSIQKEVRAEDVETLGNHHIMRAGEALQNFADTAALVSLLDLVISVDTSVVHVAGAMAKPVWILLPYFPDFRWLLDREESPWYPTARLFRQPSFGDWTSVVERLRRALA